MKNTMTLMSISTLLTAILVVPGGLAAQSPGDIGFLGYDPATRSGHLLAAKPGGALITLLTASPVNLDAAGPCPAPDNRGVVFTRSNITSLPTTDVLRLDPGQGLTTLYQLPAAFGRITQVKVDAGGDLLLLANGPNRGVYRVPRGGGPLVTIALLPSPRQNGTLFAMEEDVASGDLVVFDNLQILHRVKPNGTVQQVPFPASIQVNGIAGDAQADYATGLMWLAYGLTFLQVDPGTGAVTTIFPKSPTSIGLWNGVDADPFGGGLVLSYQSQLPPLAAFYRYRPGASKVTTVAVLPASMVYGGAAVFGSRNLSGRARPRLGTRYPIRLSVPTEAGQRYAAAAAFGTYSGIPAGGGRRIPLDPDPLFFASRALPSVFRGFQGTLDARGEAGLAIDIPPVAGLRGLRFHVAAVTVGAGGIRWITEPLGVVVE